jgi:hypothetical protein
MSWQQLIASNAPQPFHAKWTRVRVMKEAAAHELHKQR